MRDKKVAARRSFSLAMVQLARKNTGSRSDHKSHVVTLGSTGSMYPRVGTAFAILVASCYVGENLYTKVRVIPRSITI